MKLKNLTIGLALTTLMGVGIFAGLTATSNTVAEEVKAEHSITLGNSGTIYLQLNTNEWKSSGSQIGLYMFNNSVSRSAWGSLVTPSGSSRFVEYSYSLDFTPTQCIAFRFDPGVQTMGDWCWENNRGNSAIWSTTNDTDFNHVVWLGNYYPSSKWTESGAYDLNAVVKGGNSDSWSVATVDTQLTHVKVNGSDNLEVYGDVSLPANTYFKVVKGGSTWCGSYSCHSSIQSNLSGGGSSNIHNTAAATYEFYFDYDGETTYITDPDMAAADEWAQYFLAHVGCDSTGENLPSGWSSCASQYASLSGAAKNIVYGASAKVDGSYVEQAVARYDVAVANHSSLTRFIVNSGNTPRSAAIKTPATIETVETSNIVLIVAIVSFISSTGIGGYFFFKKRREN